jgi:hypothetical protein
MPSEMARVASVYNPSYLGGRGRRPLFRLAQAAGRGNRKTLSQKQKDWVSHTW